MKLQFSCLESTRTPIRAFRADTVFNVCRHIDNVDNIACVRMQKRQRAMQTSVDAQKIAHDGSCTAAFRLQRKRLYIAHDDKGAVYEQFSFNRIFLYRKNTGCI